MRQLFFVSIGGALGTGLRYLSTQCFAQALGPAFPYGTLVVNVTGCFLIAFVMGIAEGTNLIPAPTRLVITTGFLGGFTTYSSFNYDTMKLLTSERWQLGALNLLATILGCFACGLLGGTLARLLAK